MHTKHKRRYFDFKELWEPNNNIYFYVMYEQKKKKERVV